MRIDPSGGACGGGGAGGVGGRRARFSVRSTPSWREERVLEVGEGLLLVGGVAAPGAGLPDLDAVVDPDHHGVAVQAGVRPELGGDGDATLLVRHLLGGEGEQHPAVGAHAAVGLGGAGELLAEEVEVRLGADVEGPLLTTSDHQALLHLVAELRREEETALVVELRGVGAGEHPCSPSPAAIASR
jgi:hypothetical protein